MLQKRSIYNGTKGMAMKPPHALICTLIMACAAPALADVSSYERAQETPSQVLELYIVGDQDQGRDELMDAAIYQAALQTHDNGYAWFRIVRTDVERDITRTRTTNRFSQNYERVPLKTCSLFGCTTTYQTRYLGRENDSRTGQERVHYTINLTYQLASGQPTDQDNVYRAEQVITLYDKMNMDALGLNFEK